MSKRDYSTQAHENDHGRKGNGRSIDDEISYAEARRTLYRIIWPPSGERGDASKARKYLETLSPAVVRTLYSNDPQLVKIARMSTL